LQPWQLALEPLLAVELQMPTQAKPTASKQSDYREYRRRCNIYQMKMKLANREKETVFNLVTLLQGRAWDCLEDLTVEDLAKPEACATVFERLDAAFKFDAMTELPSDFESYLQEYQAEYLHTERRLTMVHKIELPEKIRAWWFLRRSGLTRDQRQLILTQLADSNLTLDKAIKAMNFIIGQDSKVDGASSRWNKGSTCYKTNAYLAEDDEAWPDDEVYLEWDDYEAEG
jgi:hypothetical protein